MGEAKSKKPFLGFTGNWLIFWITFACSTDMLMFGYDQAVFSGVIVTDHFLELHDLVGPEKTSLLSTVTAIYDIGCFAGAILAFVFGDRLGRRKTILVGTAIMAVGAVLMTASYGIEQMFVGRIVLGIGNGMNTSVAPLWQTETAPAHLRGRLVMYEMMMNMGGFSLCNWINYGFSFTAGQLAWRTPLALQFVFVIALFVTVPWLPESPRWLLYHKKDAEAVTTLACLAGKAEDDPAIIAEAEEIRYSVEYEKEHELRWKDILRPQPGATKPLRRLLLGAGTQFMQQFGGINIMGYYLPTVLITSVGLTNQLARLLTAVNSLSYLIFSSILLITLIERWGRRNLMLLSSAGQGMCFVVITILLRYGGPPHGDRKIAEASIAFFFLNFIAFGLGMLGVPWLYPTEISSIAMRSKGAAVATATNWMANFIIVQITPIGIQNLGWRFWIVFAVLNASFIPLIYLVYPETANRTLEDLDEYYRTNPSLIVFRDEDVTTTKRPLKYVEREESHVARVARSSKDMTGVQPSPFDEHVEMASKAETDRKAAV